MGDSSPADGKKRKAKKMKRGLVSTEQGDVAIPPILAPCSTCTNDTSSCSLTKKICFWGQEQLSPSTSWFVVNIPRYVKHQPIEEMNDLDVFDHHILHRHIERGVKDITQSPVFSLPYSCNPIIPTIYNTYATLGSFVYSIGGFYSYPADTTLRGCNLVFCIDTNNRDENNCWKEAPSMINHRQKSQAITVNDKLYVFGCFGEEQCPHNPECCSWAEFFDPLTGKWSSLPVPMFKDSLVVCSPNQMKKTHIVKKIAALVDEYYVYELDIETKSWDRIATLQQGYLSSNIQPALVNNTLYWFTKDANAYDISKDEHFEGPVQDYSFHHAMNMVSKVDYRDAPKPKVLHLGRRYFCILGNLSNLKEGSRRIHCAVIKLSKTKEWYKQHNGRRPDISKFFLRARVLSCQSFPIDRELKFLDGWIM